MAGFRDKITPFVLGLSIGLLAACLFFIFRLDKYIRKIDLSALTLRNKVTEEVVKPLPEKEQTEERKTEKNYRKEESSVSKKNNNTYEAGGNFPDTSYTQNENYRVLKEELQSVKNIYVRDLAPKERTSIRDSLIASMAGVTMPDDKEFFMIEFWKSPLNSKGYRMTRGRILIYGFNEGQDLELVKLNEKYYLRNNKVVYTVSYTSDFKPMERAQENEVSGKFN